MLLQHSSACTMIFVSLQPNDDHSRGISRLSDGIRLSALKVARLRLDSFH